MGAFSAAFLFFFDILPPVSFFCPQLPADDLNICFDRKHTMNTPHGGAEKPPLPDGAARGDVRFMKLTKKQERNLMKLAQKTGVGPNGNW